MKEIKPEKGLETEESNEGVNALAGDELIAALVESNSITAVALLRIYDVLMCQYAEANPDDAAALVKLHAEGKIRSQLPYLDMS